MALTVEDGTGIVGAESYASVATIDAFWAARSQVSIAAAWAAADTAVKEGAARIASEYLDAVWGSFYVGFMKEADQGLLFPRIASIDEDGEDVLLVDGLGRDLPSLPPQIVAATCELAGRAISGALSIDRDGGVLTKSTKVGPISKAVSYRVGALPSKLYGHIDILIAPLLNGQQPNAVTATWFWL